jgi:hypothetical protein
MRLQQHGADQYGYDNPAGEDPAAEPRIFEGTHLLP